MMDDIPEPRDSMDYTRSMTNVQSQSNTNLEHILNSNPNLTSILELPVFSKVVGYYRPGGLGRWQAPQLTLGSYTMYAANLSATM